MELKIASKNEEDVHTLTVQGKVDLYSSPKLRELIFATVKHHQPRTMIVELSDVTYFDSSGIATLVEGLQLARQHTIRFKLAGLSRAVLEVFQLTRLEEVFDIYATAAEAKQD